MSLAWAAFVARNAPGGTWWGCFVCDACLSVGSICVASCLMQHLCCLDEPLYHDPRMVCPHTRPGLHQSCTA